MINMNHKVTSVQNLYNSAMTLYNNVVVGGESSADSILNNIYNGIENLKANWKGKDAGIRIQELIRVYNAMVAVRNTLAKLAADSSYVACNYREIQNANGAGLESLNRLFVEDKTILGNYFDNSDTINITTDAEKAKSLIDGANSQMNTFESKVKSKYNEIMENWTAGAGRDAAQNAFNSFISNVGQYKQTLSEVSTKISTALKNYTL